MNRLGGRILAFFEELGAMVIFGRQVIAAIPSLRRYKFEFYTQMYQVGTRALPVTIVSGLFVGAIFATQFYLQLKGYGANSAVGGLNTSGTIRDLGPLLVAFMLSGKIGAFMSAELGTMRVTDQVDAIRCLGTDPFEYLLAPRFVAVVLMTFVLLFFALIVSIVGGMLSMFLTAGIHPAEYISSIPDLVSPISVVTGLSKSAVFGFLIAWICCYQGFSTYGGAKGVGLTVNRTAVLTVIAIILADFTIATVIDWITLFFQWGH